MQETLLSLFPIYRRLPKLDVAGSNPVSRSIPRDGQAPRENSVQLRSGVRRVFLRRQRLVSFEKSGATPVGHGGYTTVIPFGGSDDEVILLVLVLDHASQARGGVPNVEEFLKPLQDHYGPKKKAPPFPAEASYLSDYNGAGEGT